MSAIQSWLERCILELVEGEQLFLEASDARAAKELKKQFISEYKFMQGKLRGELPSFQFTAIKKDSRFWLCITRSKVDLSIAYKKTNRGELERLSVHSTKADRYRYISAMKQDGMTLKEARVLLPDLQENEYN
jgi:hypothetical protein